MRRDDTHSLRSTLKHDVEIVSDHSRMKKDSGGKECQSAEKTESYKQEEMCQVCEEKKRKGNVFVC